MHYFGTVFKSGNSLALRLPTEYARQQKLSPKQRVALPDTVREAKNHYDTEAFWEVVNRLKAASND